MEYLAIGQAHARDVKKLLVQFLGMGAFYSAHVDGSTRVAFTWESGEEVITAEKIRDLFNAKPGCARIAIEARTYAY
jgi:hypothetical protein